MISDPHQETVHDSLVYSLEVTIGRLHPHYIYECSVTAITVGEGPPASLQLQMLEDSKFIAEYLISSEGIDCTYVRTYVDDCNNSLLGIIM